MQVESAISKDIDEENYYKMVKDKTSSLISASTLIGAITVTENKEKRDALFNYGEKLGTMFQIKDDLLDITGLEREVGKPTMFDLKKNMLTLPYIYVINKVSVKEKNKITSNLKYHAKKNNFNEIKSLIIDNGGIEYANKKIEEYSSMAYDQINYFDDSKYKDLLINTIEFNSNRKF